MFRLLRFFSLVLATVFLFFLTIYRLGLPVNSKSTAKIEFVIERGQNLDQITKNLKTLKIIRSVPAAKFLILIKGLSKQIQAGYFYLSPSQSLSEIVQNLSKASNKQTWITIPEGLRREETALVVSRAMGNNPNFNVDEFITATAFLEGHLFPETYALNPESGTKQIITKLTNQFDKVAQELGIPSAEIENVLILASILERESIGDSEMLEIAGILKKRLASNWPLQIDATIQFALANQQCTKLDCDYWSNALTKQDLEITSAYNTYKNIGLPPGPIASPGRAALNAAFNATVSQYWFYLHDPSGKVHFAKTIEEHNQNICIYLKKDC